MSQSPPPDESAKSPSNPRDSGEQVVTSSKKIEQELAKRLSELEHFKTKQLATATLEPRVAGLETFRTTQLAIIGVLTALGLGALFSGEWHALKAALAASAAASEKAEIAIRMDVNWRVREVLIDLLPVMDSFSRTSRDADLTLQLSDVRSRIDHMSLMKAFMTKDTVATIDAAKRYLELAAKYLDASSPGKEWDVQRLARLRFVLNQWTNLDLSIFTKFDDDLALRLESRRHNAIGIMNLMLEREDPSKPPTSRDYSKARQHFEEAARNDANSASAYSNLGIVSVYEWKASNRKNLDLLDSAYSNYRQAAKLATAGYLKSVAYNNMAMSAVRKADWLFANKRDTESLRAALSDAQRYVSKAAAQSDARPVVHVTWAEAMCVELKTQQVPKDKAPADWAQQALARLQHAVDLGYVEFQGKTVARLSTDWEFLAYCTSAVPDFMTRIAALRPN